MITMNAITVTPDFSWFMEIFNGFVFLDMRGFYGIIFTLIISLAIVQSSEVKGLFFPVGMALNLTGIHVNNTFLWLTGLMFILEIVSLNQIGQILSSSIETLGRNVKTIMPTLDSGYDIVNLEERNEFNFRNKQARDSNWKDKESLMQLATLNRQREEELEKENEGIIRKHKLKKSLEPKPLSKKRRIKLGIDELDIKTAIQEQALSDKKYGNKLIKEGVEKEKIEDAIKSIFSSIKDGPNIELRKKELEEELGFKEND